MRVAVTGDSGFIGQQVLLELQKQDCEKVAVTREAGRLSGLDKGSSVVEMDLDHPPFDCFEKLNKPDTLIHLAWDGLPNYKSRHHFETELPRQYRFLKLLIEAGLPGLLVSGTCFEYGMQSGVLSEDMDTRPANPYGFAKDTLRGQLEFLQKDIPFDLTWARLFYLYGKGQAETSLLPQLENAVRSGDTMFNMSGGEQLRDFIPVAKAASILVRLALAGSNKGIVNICSGKPVSVKHFVEQWIDRNGWQIKLNLGYYPYPDYEPMEFWGDRRKLDQCLVAA